MSNLYMTEPATNGKVILVTTSGEIEIELWGKEAPDTVRNFVQLSLEGYYDNVIFHRIVKDFIIQTGDPTGTGKGGESIYGEPFKDEIHSRLRFNKRGMIGMANSSKRNTNTSQFFITLDRADELTNKHTLFGKVVGNTYYNVMGIGEIDCDEHERPRNPPRIKTVRVIENPFPDIVPRITAQAKREQARARAEAKKDAEQRERRAKAKKNTGLLSFGEAEEISVAEVAIKKKGITRPDLLEHDDGSSKRPVEQFVDVPASLADLGAKDKEKTRDESKGKVDLKEIRAQHERDKASTSAARQAEIARMTSDLRQLKKRAGEQSDSDSDSESGRKRRKGPSALEQEMARYSKNRGRAAARLHNRKNRRDEEDDVLAQMASFVNRVARVADGGGQEEGAEGAESGDEREGAVGSGMRGKERSLAVASNDKDGDGRIQNDAGVVAGAGTADEVDLEVDDDVGWLRHRLKFDVDEKELTRRAEEEYAVIDPRAKTREIVGDERRDKPRKRKVNRHHLEDAR